MPSLSFTVGKTEKNGVALSLNGAAVSTGSASIHYFIVSGGGPQYLQSDVTTFSPTPNTFPLTYGAEGWTHDIVIPASAAGSTLHWEAVHSLYGVIGAESNYCTVLDLDTVGITPSPHGARIVAV